MRILYLCNKKYVDSKMSRVRFHAIKAISKLAYVKWWGIGWEQYNSNLTVQENIDILGSKFDLVVAYKPLEMKNFKDIDIPKCIRYNEMFDAEWTRKEIIESGANFVICHHKNEMLFYQDSFPNVKFIYIPHCAEKTVFRQYDDCKKEYDLLLVGCLGSRYPLRVRMAKILKNIQKQGKWKCKIHQHPGYNLPDAHTDKYLIDFAREINKSRIVVTCCGIYRSRYGKLVEIPMCGSVMATDLPDNGSEFEQFAITLNHSMTDNEIIRKLEYYLNNNTELEKMANKGLVWSQTYIQENYATRFINALSDFLNLGQNKDDGSIIQSLWIGGSLSNLEILSIKSFLQNGHTYHLYTYENIDNVPDGAVIKDGNEILPKSEIFRYSNGSVSAFSNMFRYKLLLEKGGYWVDADVICLKHFDFEEPYVFATEPSNDYQISNLNPCIIKAPEKSLPMFLGYKFCQSKKADVLSGKIPWNLGPSSFSYLIQNSETVKYAKPWFHFNSHFCGDWYSILMNPTRLKKQYQEKTGKVFNKPILNDLNNRPSENYAVHLYNEIWRRNGCNKNAIYEQGCLYEQLKQRYGVTNDRNENGNKNGNKNGKHNDDTIIINIVGEHNGKVVVYPISSKN